MSLLTVHPENHPEQFQVFRDPQAITKELQEIGVQFERWEASASLPPDADQESILKAYKPSVDRLILEHGFQSSDVIRLNPDHPERSSLRQKFLNEHVHSEFEVRFFVEGKGLFFLHPSDKVYAVLCERGDLISVPDGVKHWFDMGENPSFTCIRLFTNPEGWVAQFTGDPIAERFPTLDTFPGTAS
ncbi:MAG: hypothetical protein RLZ25_469 [Pseudomonadota bacterium]|jgi:1,2-dihydroxy-3-keto-5-methylthiopentene dioxygenase